MASHWHLFFLPIFGQNGNDVVPDQNTVSSGAHLSTIATEEVCNRFPNTAEESEL